MHVYSTNVSSVLRCQLSIFLSATKVHKHIYFFGDALFKY